MTSILTTLEGRTLYTRHTDKSLPVTITGGQFVLDGGESYSTFRGLITAVSGRTPRLSVKRYFGLDHSTKAEPELGLFDLFRPKTRVSFGIIHRQRGIDLNKRGHEVAKILMGCFSTYLAELASLGVTYDDVLQEVYKGVLIRNAGDGAWNPNRSKFGSYVWMVCSSVLYNLKNRAMRLKSREDIGVYEMRDGGVVKVDVAQASRSPLIADVDSYYALELDEALVDLYDTMGCSGESDTHHGQLAEKVLPLILEGHTRKAIAARLDERPHRITRAVKYLREQALIWKGGL